MPFCTNCGGQIGADTRFCSNCGSPLSGAADPPAPVVAALPPLPLEYTVHGDNLQVVRIRLKPGQEIYAEAGKMVYKTANIHWESRMTGESLGARIWGALKRTMMGESLFFTYFRALSPGEVGLAGDYPGRIQVFELASGQSVLVQRDSFVCAQSSVQLNVAFVKRLGAGLLGGEGFILEKLTGPRNSPGRARCSSTAAAISSSSTSSPAKPCKWTLVAWWVSTSPSATTSSWPGASRPPSSAAKASFWPPSPVRAAPSSRA